MTTQTSNRDHEKKNADVLGTLALRRAPKSVRSTNMARSQRGRLGALNAPMTVVGGDKRTAINWLRRAIRAERGLAVRGAAQYSFSRHMALLRALAVELDPANQHAQMVQQRTKARPADNARS